jgi:hypothetical protein
MNITVLDNEKKKATIEIKNSPLAKAKLKDGKAKSHAAQ